MKLVIIAGNAAVGKMSVGQELMKQTGLRLFHNHMTIEPVIEIFGGYNYGVVQKIREVIFQEFIKSKNEGMIFTFMWYFDLKGDWDYIMHIADMFDEVYCVELVAPQEIRLQRNVTENRLNNKPSKRNIESSTKNLIEADEKHRLESLEGEIPFENYIKIDNSNLEPTQVATMIKEHFNL